MRLTLDWDSEKLEEMHRPAVRNRSPANEQQQRIADFHDAPAASDKWELWRSSGHGHGDEEDSDGYHYVEYDLAGDLEDMRRLRRTYGDDALRISLDGKRVEWGSPYISVLYHLKNIRKSEKTPPYSTNKRAELVERHGFGDGDGAEYADVNTKHEDGTLDYQAIIRALADHPDFGSRAALYRTIQSRDSVDVSTDASKRAYDHLNGRRPIQRAEKKALRYYAESRGLGHYAEPAPVDGKPQRSTFHEYWEMPEVEFDTQDFGQGDTDSGGDSEWFPVNMRTGTYGDVDETTVRQVHESVADTLVETLSPGMWQDGEDGREYHGLDLSRWGYAISLERERPLDADEVARYRRAVVENQPGITEDEAKARLYDDSGTDPFAEDGSGIMWEVIVYDGADALERASGTDYWWIARGVVNADNSAEVRRPIDNGTILADTRGWL